MITQYPAHFFTASIVVLNPQLCHHIVPINAYYRVVGRFFALPNAWQLPSCPWHPMVKMELYDHSMNYSCHPAQASSTLWQQLPVKTVTKPT